jgi:hypothetical protein
MCRIFLDLYKKRSILQSRIGKGCLNFVLAIPKVFSLHDKNGDGERNIHGEARESI